MGSPPTIKTFGAGSRPAKVLTELVDTPIFRGRSVPGVRKAPGLTPQRILETERPLFGFIESALQQAALSSDSDNRENLSDQESVAARSPGKASSYLYAMKGEARRETTRLAPMGTKADPQGKLSLSPMGTKV